MLDLKRREFITLLGGAAAAWPLAAQAQQTERVRRVGVLMHVTENDKDGQERLGPLMDRLKELGCSKVVICDWTFAGARTIPTVIRGKLLNW